MKKDTLSTIRNAKAELEKALFESQKETTTSLISIREHLHLILQEFGYEFIVPEVKNEVLKLVEMLRLESAKPTQKERLRSPKVSTEQKIEWIEKTLGDGKILKADLLKRYATEFSTLRNPASLDKALSDKRFTKTPDGHNIVVSKAKGGGTASTGKS
jgi:hypothetical protein